MPDVVVGIEGTGSGVVVGLSGDRDRLVDALTRVATEYGYVDVDAEQVARAARLTLDDFHRSFDDTDQCLLAAQDRFLERLYEHVEDACAGVETWPGKVKRTIESAFEFVAELHGAARLFVIDTKRTGPAALERSCSSIDDAAALLKQGREVFPAAAEMPDVTERTLVAGVVMMAVTHLLAEEAELLPERAPEAVELVLTPYIGARRARFVAND